MKIPISKIGPLQKIDVKKAGRYHDDYGRVCQVIQSKNWHGDLSSLRIAKLFGKHWQHWDKHFVVQVAGCSLKCPYCYVDNLNPDKIVTAKELVSLFFEFSEIVPDLNVFHLCGGMPARYPKFWEELRDELNNTGLREVVLLTDTVFVEHTIYNVFPWCYIELPYFALVGCLKGTTRQNFFVNTGQNLFDEALKELKCYVEHKNFWMSLINYDPLGLAKIFDIVPFERIDFLKVVNYVATYKL